MYFSWQRSTPSHALWTAHNTFHALLSCFFKNHHFILASLEDVVPVRGLGSVAHIQASLTQASTAMESPNHKQEDYEVHIWFIVLLHPLPSTLFFLHFFYRAPTFLGVSPPVPSAPSLATMQGLPSWQQCCWHGHARVTESRAKGAIYRL